MRTPRKSGSPPCRHRGRRWRRTSAIAIFLAALWSVACDRDAAPQPRRIVDVGEAQRLLFPALFAPARSVEEERCAGTSRTAVVPSWLREAVEAPRCGDALRAQLTAFAAAPVADDIGTPRRRRQDLLTAAAVCDATAIVERLLASGADVNGRDGCGATALLAAASSGATGAARRLLQARADPNLAAGVGRWSRTPLLAALIHGDGDLARVLLEAGADPNASTPGGRTALMFAATIKDLPLLALLLKHGADPCRSDEAGLDASRVAQAHNLLVQAALLAEKAASCGARPAVAATPRERALAR